MLTTSMWTPHITARMHPMREGIAIQGLLGHTLITSTQPRQSLEYGRKFNTGSQYDVQFTDMKKEYSFGTAIFDNAQTRHSYETGVSKLVFAAPARYWLRYWLEEGKYNPVFKYGDYLLSFFIS